MQKLIEVILHLYTLIQCFVGFFPHVSMYIISFSPLVVKANSCAGYLLILLIPFYKIEEASFRGVELPYAFFFHSLSKHYNLLSARCHTQEFPGRQSFSVKTRQPW